MNSDLAIVIADAVRQRAIRLESPFSGRVLYFTDSSLISALESIRAHKPRVVAIESQLAHSGEGRAFIDRLKAASIQGCELHLIAYVNGRWTTSLVGAAPIEVAAPVAARVAAPVAAVNTRRVPRFPLLASRAAVVDGKETNLVDMSVMGAQVVSLPVLKPNQRLKISLPDEGDEELHLTGYVAWAMFERRDLGSQPQYRAGMEFTDAAAQALEKYCRRHCSGKPLIPRVSH
jgi:PilZ domain